MADLTKRAQKRLADHLRAGESVQAALLCEPKGTYGMGMVALALVPRFADSALADRSAAANQESGGIAASFPSSSCVVAITECRVVVVESNGLRFGAPVLELPLADIAVDQIAGKGLGKSLRFAFSDGSAVSVDAQRGQPFDRFASLLDPAGPVS